MSFQITFEVPQVVQSATGRSVEIGTIEARVEVIPDKVYGEIDYQYGVVEVAGTLLSNGKAAGTHDWHRVAPASNLAKAIFRAIPSSSSANDQIAAGLSSYAATVKNAAHSLVPESL